MMTPYKQTFPLMSEASALFNFGNKVDVAHSSQGVRMSSSSVLFVLSNQEKAIVNQTAMTFNN